jgi:glycosyltransferase involved in cell wall biosynthesis
MKILFVAQNLQMGGIQKALVNTIKELNKEKKIEIDVFSFGDGPLIEEIPDNINIFYGSLLLRLISTPFSVIKSKGNILHTFLRIICMILVRIFGSEKFYRLLFKMQRNFKEYDVAVSYFNDVQGGYFNRGTNQFVIENIYSKRKLAWIHTDPIKAGFEYYTSLNIYKDFDKIVCVSNACRQKFIELLPELKDKTQVVYNLFPIEEIKSKSIIYNPFEKTKISIVSVGRIDNSTKRFHLIPEICKMLRDNSIINYKWRIIGDGPDIESNKQLIKTLGVSDFVEFVGEEVNPYPYVKKSDILVLTSAYEGYPMVVGESLILGTPVLTTCYSSAYEQIIENYNGLITGMEKGNIFTVIKYLLTNQLEIERMKKNIINDGFSNKNALKQFLKVIDSNDDI